MSALAVETTAAPEWAGRLVVRAAGHSHLHVAVEGAVAPRVPVFTVPLECAPDAEQAPGVRPWDGPVTASDICPACLRALRGEPEPERPRPVPSGVAEELPEPDRRGRHLWAVPEPVTYAPAPLPSEHAGRPITWSAWTKSPVLSHYDPSCEWCGDPGPGEMAGGRQTNPLRRYVAYRCTACQEMTAYEQVGSELQTIVHHKSRAPKDCNR
ncbi:hypothetical protein [Streptomyces griseomycini]|uniref:Uncharacterized protein n=1 Tax=Streptomyces griseomycini TaxID=66895 RepID=A0A7W7VA41_9ACTN|nr:hypothetical protein [Streptomyces griseomycini]MBB4902549.1 hypothetical protein [Streptomyces griseomycini]GGR52333.1 hypothetical protein GCM10015536_67410 [Streptomyces griseomycini]